MGTTDYEALRKKLNETTEWPAVYFFKFIIPADNQKLAQVEALFGPEATVSIKQSTKGNFSSVSAKELMMNAEEVITRYQKANAIEGLMAL